MGPVEMPSLTNDEVSRVVEEMTVGGMTIQEGEVYIKSAVMQDHQSRREHAQRHVIDVRETGLRHRPRKQPAPAADSNCHTTPAK